MAYPWGDDRRYNSYSGYFRRLFGFRVQKLSVHAGFTCPNRDGTLSSGGCTFCDNAAFSPSYCTPDKSVRRQLEEGIEFHRRRYRSAERYLAYFQSFSNTYAPLERLREVFSQAFELPEVAGIVVGTRPDCIDGPKLDYFARLAETRYVAIEYGIESCYDATLRSVNRGHDFACARRAVEMTSERGIRTGAHFILGLPGETPAMMEASVDAINSLALDTVKFHQLQLFRGTTMAAQYAADPGRFRFRGTSTSISLSACSSVCDRIWSSSGSPARRRRAFKPVLRGGSCVTSNSGHCSNGGSSSAAHGRDVCTYSGPEVTANGVVRG